MDTAGMATVMIGMRIARMQMAVAARMLSMSTDNASSIVQVIEAAQQNIDRLANVAAGIGAQVDMTA